MQFIKTATAAVGEVDLAERLNRALLSDEHVLWLVSGGSNIPRTAGTLQLLKDTPKNKLTIMLVDERYGILGHADSNAHQLETAGIDFSEISFIPVLKNESLEQTVKEYAEAFDSVSQQAKYVFAQFGIGTDGHLAGILPGSAAIDSSSKVVAYVADDYTRITLTPQSLLTIQTAFVFAWGKEKLPALLSLKDQDLPLTRQPAQLLKKIPEVYVYNDQIGD